MYVNPDGLGDGGPSGRLKAPVPNRGDRSYRPLDIEGLRIDKIDQRDGVLQL